jgi:hypothetical protein
LNDIDQTRYILDGRPIPIDYENLRKAYQLRNEIVHEFKNPKISNWGILSLWDNIMNIMDISVTVFLSAADPQLRSSLDSDYQRGIERKKKKKLCESYSQKVLKFLNEKGPIPILEDGKLSKYFLNAISVNDNNISTNNINWIIRKMVRRKLISISNNKACLTAIGTNRAKKL